MPLLPCSSAQSSALPGSLQSLPHSLEAAVGPASVRTGECRIKLCLDQNK